MFKSTKLLEDILIQQKITNKLLAKIAGMSEEELEIMSPAALDFSTTEYIPPKSEEELLEEEDDELSLTVESRLADAERNGRASFYAEDNVSDIAESSVSES